MRKFLDREDGVAMVTAILVTMVVLALSITMVQLSFHNDQTSTYDRGRVEAVNAAEAGIDLVYQQMERNGFGGLPCGTNAMSGDLATSPVEHYSVTIAYYPAWPISGSPLSCPLTDDPLAATVTSTGTAPGASGSRMASRTMQSAVRLRQISSSGSFLGAMYGKSGISFNNSITVNGNLGNDANVYTGGAWTCANGANVAGSVYALSVSQTGTCTVNTDVWATNAIDANGLMVGHNIKSSTSSISLSGKTQIQGDATSGTTCGGCTTGANGRVLGHVYTNTVSPPPPLPTFPVVNYVQSDWTNPPDGSPGYTIMNYTDCTTPQPFILNPPDSKRYVVRISPACNLSWNNKIVMHVKNDFAVITDGDINMTNSVQFVSDDGQPHNVYFIVPANSNPTCGNGQINFNNASGTSTIHLFIYTPCNVNYTNAAGLNGQIFGGTVNVTNSFSMSYYPVYVPGYSPVPGYNVDIAYVREITS